MSAESLIEAMPDVVAFLRPDGLITHHAGGRDVPFLNASGSLAGRRLEEVLPAQTAELLKRLARRAIATRADCESPFTVDSVSYRVRLVPQRPDRVLCVIGRSAAMTEALPAGDAPAPGVRDRRSFVLEFQNSVSDCVLRERPLALCLIFLDGLGEVSRLVDFAVGERMLAEMLTRLPASGAEPDSVTWYYGQIGSVVIGVVIEGFDERERIREVISSVCDALTRPIPVGDARFHCSPRVGVALLGEDASRANLLFDHANAALLEARRGEPGTIQFYSDTLRLLPMSRIDIERELRLAITHQQIELRYVARHDLGTGRVVGVQAYLRWRHPLRGDIAPAEFLPIAAATGLALALSRAALHRLLADLSSLRARYGSDVSISFAALRQHVASGQLLADCIELTAAAKYDLGHLELRLAEQTLAGMAQPERALREWVDFGARVIIDEFGGGFCSLAQLPLLPLAGLQIDRRLVVSSGTDSAALRSCKAIVGLAKALDITPIAAGVDAESTRRLMLDLGCDQGLGDLYPAVERRAQEPAALGARAPRICR